MASATLPHTPTGTHRMTRSASVTPAAASVVASSAIPSSRTRATTDSLGIDGDDRAREIEMPRGAGDRRADQAEADEGDALEERRFMRRTETLRHAVPPTEIAQSRHHEAVRLLVADRQAQGVGEAVGIDPAQDQPAAGQERVRILRRPARVFREMDEQEIADARRDLEAQGLDLAGEPGEPFLVVLDGLRDMRLVLDRGDAGGHGRAVDVERDRGCG